MRKLTKTIAVSFLAGERKTLGNTSTDGTTLFLHGNPIAKKEKGILWISLAGWNTPTTRERLTGLGFLTTLGFYVCQRKGKPYIGDRHQDGVRLFETEREMMLTGWHGVGPHF